MSETSYVVVFPTIFARNRITQLISNIRQILKVRNQPFKSVKRDGDIILVDANDPVFASSAINLLFGIKRVAIARQKKNDFKEIVSEITSIGGNLLLKGEKFLVRVDGTSRGFLAKDVEIAATSEIIEKKSGLGARPGTEEDHDKLLYAHLTKDNAYICIFSDEGKGGIPYHAQRQAVCAVYDEMSAVSCYETIKQGYDVAIIVCYRQESELTNLAKMLNQIIPRLVRDKVELEFYQVGVGPSGAKNYLVYLGVILEIMLRRPNTHVSLALSPLVFSAEFADGQMRRVFERKKIPVIPLAGVDTGLFDEAREIGLERGIKRLEKLVTARPAEAPGFSEKIVSEAIKTRRKVSVRVGPNNVHDILDSLDH